MLKFTKDHEWLRIEGDIATVGITQYAQEQLGDLVFVELPAPGSGFEPGAGGRRRIGQGRIGGLCPISGEITDVNQSIVDEPSLVNSDPMGKWFFKMKIADPSQIETLMDEPAYRALVS